MAIATGDMIEKFGTLANIHTGTPAGVNAGAFSVLSDVAAWTNSDDVPECAFVLKCQWGSTVGVANKPINIYARPIDIQSTNDPVTPSANRLAQCIGYFNCYAAAATTDYYFDSTRCVLPNMKSAQVFEFYLENQSGQAIGSGWNLWLMPISKGPKA